MKPEQKPPFSAIPTTIVDKIAALTGSRSVAGETVYGGFSAAANFRLDLEDGRRVFAKGAHPGDLSHATQHLRQEIEIYETAPLLRVLSPRYLGCVDDGDEDGWALGLWEWIDKKDSASLPALMKALAAWHETPPPASLPSCTRRNFISGFFLPEGKWHKMAEQKPRARFLSLFADTAAAEGWLAQNLPALLALQSRARACAHEEILMHGDLRTDNVMEDKAGKIYVADWPNACKGPAAFDLLTLFASIAGDIEERRAPARGRDIGSLLETYEQAGGRRQAENTLLTLAASLSGYMADNAGRAAPEKMPRLRWMQGRMLFALLDYLASRGAVTRAPGTVASPNRFPVT